MNYMNVLSDFEIRLRKYFPDTYEQDQIYKMGAELIEKDMIISNQASEIEKLTKKITKLSPKKKTVKKATPIPKKERVKKAGMEIIKKEPAKKGKPSIHEDILELSEVAFDESEPTKPSIPRPKKNSSTVGKTKKTKK